MRRDLSHLQQWRLKDGIDGGLWLIPHRPSGRRLLVVASWGMGWDHASVSLPNRCPTWDEMCFVKALFFEPEECVVEFHPPASRYVNNHPYCLHLWRCQTAEQPQPPEILVGIKGAGVLTEGGAA